MANGSTILSLNTRSIPFTKSRLRLKAIAEEIETEDIDFVNFQEVHTYTHLLLLRRHLPSYPHISFSPALYGPRSGLVTFSKVPFSSHVFIRFSKLGALYNKSIIAQIIRNGILITDFGNSNLAILNTHLTPNTDLNWSKTNRFYPYIETQVFQLADLTNDLTSQGKQVIIAGDFNTPKDTGLYKAFMEKTNATDLLSAHDFPTYHGEFLPDDKKPRRIDFIFLAGKGAGSIKHTSSHMFTKKISIGHASHYPSDHIGLRATVTL